MRYKPQKSAIQKLKTKCTNLTLAVVIAFTGLSGTAPLFLSQTATAAGDTEVINQDFNNYDGDDADAPNNWSFDNIGMYDTAESSGSSGPHSLTFNTSGEDLGTATVELPLASNQQASSVSFWMQQEGSSRYGFGGTFSVSESADGTSFSTVKTYGSSSIPTTGSTFKTPLDSSAKYVQFSWDKIDGNVALDDVAVAANTASAPTIVSTSLDNSKTLTATVQLDAVIDNYDTSKLAHVAFYAQDTTTNPVFESDLSNAGGNHWNNHNGNDFDTNALDNGQYYAVFTLSDGSDVSYKVTGVTVDNTSPIQVPDNATPTVVAKVNKLASTAHPYYALTYANFDVDQATYELQVEGSNVTKLANIDDAHEYIWQDGSKYSSNTVKLYYHLANDTWKVTTAQYDNTGSLFMLNGTVVDNYQDKAAPTVKNIKVDKNSVQENGKTYITTVDNDNHAKFTITLKDSGNAGFPVHETIHPRLCQVKPNDPNYCTDGNFHGKSAVTTLTRHQDNKNLASGSFWFKDKNLNGKVKLFLGEPNGKHHQYVTDAADNQFDPNKSVGTYYVDNQGPTVVAGTPTPAKWYYQSGGKTYIRTKPGHHKHTTFNIQLTDNGGVGLKDGDFLHFHLCEVNDPSVCAGGNTKIKQNGHNALTFWLKNPNLEGKSNLYLNKGYTDLLGNPVNSSKIVATFYADNQGPTATLASPKSNRPVSGLVEFKFNVKDNLSGVKKVYYNIQDKDGNNMTVGDVHTFRMKQNSDGTWSYTNKIDTSQLPDGTYKFNVRAVDNNGNVKYTRPKLGPIHTDNTPPKATVTQKYESKHGGRIAVTLKFSEPIVPSSLPNSGQGWACSSDAKTCVKRYYNSEQHTVTFNDLAGNQGSVTFTTDYTAPKLTVSEPSSDKTISLKDSGYTTSGIVADADPSQGISRVALYVADNNGKAFGKKDKSIGSNGEWSIKVPKGALSDGTYTFSFTAYDKVGNPSKVVRHQVTVDSTTPRVKKVEQQYQSKQGGRVDVTLTFSEPIDANSLPQGWYENAGSNGTKFNKVFNRSKSYTVTFKDLAGNSNSYTFNVDADGPTLDVTTPANNEVFGGSKKPTITVKANASDPSDLGAYCVKLSGVNGGSCVDNGYAYHPANGQMPEVTIDTSNLASGKYTLTVRVTDRNGYPTEVTRTIYVDNTQPANSSRITSPTNGQVLNTGTFEIKGVAKDSLSGIDPSRVYITVTERSGFGGSSTRVGSTAYTNEQATYNSASHTFSYGISNLADGYYRIQLKAYDNAGNVRYDTIEVHVDTSAPSAPNGSESNTRFVRNTNILTLSTFNRQFAFSGAGGSASNSNVTTNRATAINTVAFASNPGTLSSASTRSTGQVLGASTAKPSKPNGHVKADKTVTVKDAADVSGGNSMSLAWYWWLLIAAAVVAIIAGVYRRAATDNKSA
jgi:hypothetical protein